MDNLTMDNLTQVSSLPAGCKGATGSDSCPCCGAPGTVSVYSEPQTGPEIDEFDFNCTCFNSGVVDQDAYMQVLLERAIF